jgi:cation diffusion facilitator family transporter
VTFTPDEARQASRLRTVLFIVGAFFVVELAGAIAAGSVVLQADAIHLLTDVLALGVSLFAMRLAVRRPTPRFTYGLRRAEPVAAIFSAVLVLLTTALIVAEGVEALREGAAPRPGVMIAVAAMALVVNGISAWLLHGAIGHAHHDDDPDNPDDHPARGPHHDHEHLHDHARGHGHDHAHDHRDGHPEDHDAQPQGAPAKAAGHALNLRGAWLHLLGDALGAVAALVAALVVRFGGYPAADPIASFAVAAILLVGSLRLLRDATLVLLEAAPRHLPVKTIQQAVLGLPGVVEVHDLHVWTLGAGHDAVTLHVRTDSRDPAFGAALSARVRELLGVEYVTVQTEVAGESDAN